MTIDYTKLSIARLLEILAQNPPDTPHYQRAHIELQRRRALEVDDQVIAQARSSGKKPPSVFICYASDDERSAQDLYSYLKRAGAEPWLDKVNLVLGDNWERELKDAVLAADAFVVCLRPGFDEIGFRQREVRWAMEALELRPPGRGFIIPLIIEPCELPEWCRPFHAGSDRSRPTRFDEVLRAIEKHCNWKSSTDPVAIDESESEEPQELPRPGPVDLELYDRRLRIYKALQKLIQGVLRDATVTLNQLAEFIKDTNEARFLFDRNLSDYLDEVHKQAVRLRYANQRLSGPNRPVGEECSELGEEQARIFTWFEKEYSENARERFSRYLSVEP